MSLTLEAGLKSLVPLRSNSVLPVEMERTCTPTSASESTGARKISCRRWTSASCEASDGSANAAGVGPAIKMTRLAEIGHVDRLVRKDFKISLPYSIDHPMDWRWDRLRLMQGALQRVGGRRQV